MRYVGNPISIREGTEGREISGDRVFFTFASGRLAYDCVTCQATCCRGHGYNVNSTDELRRQIENAPGLALFVDSPLNVQDARLYHVGNCPPSCFFLTEGNLCRIHQEHGYQAKPETCRLFPFNDLLLFGSYLVVRPHASLCPLQILPADVKSTLSDHDQLLETMSLKGIATPVARANGPAGLADALVTREEHILDLSEVHLRDGDYLAFAAAQLDTGAAPLDCEVDWNWEIRRFANELRELLTIPPAPVDPSPVARVIIAMTPYLRSCLLLGGSSTDVSGPRHLPASRIPQALLVLSLIAESARSIGMREITFQTVIKLFNDFLPMICLLAHLDEILIWQHRAPIPIPTWNNREFLSGYISIGKALLASSQRANPTGFGDVLRMHSRFGGVDRFVFLKEIARQLFGRVTTVEEAVAWNGRRRIRDRVESAVHRAALAHLGEKMLGVVYTRVAASKGKK